MPYKELLGLWQHLLKPTFEGSDCQSMHVKAYADNGGHVLTTATFLYQYFSITLQVNNVVCFVKCCKAMWSTLLLHLTMLLCHYIVVTVMVILQRNLPQKMLVHREGLRLLSFAALV